MSLNNNSSDNNKAYNNLSSDIANLIEENKELNERLNNNSSDNDKVYNNLSSDIANLIEENERLNQRINNNSQYNDEVYYALLSEIANLTEQIQILNQQLENSTENNDELVWYFAFRRSKSYSQIEDLKPISIQKAMQSLKAQSNFILNMTSNEPLEKSTPGMYLM